MREDCRHFASRTYDDGETARFCVLDLAPEAPWRCPENCAHYEQTVVDGSFVEGSLALPQVEDEPDENPEAIQDLLDDAEMIVDAAVRARRTRCKAWWWSQVVATVEAGSARGRRRLASEQPLGRREVRGSARPGERFSNRLEKRARQCRCTSCDYNFSRPRHQTVKGAGAGPWPQGSSASLGHHRLRHATWQDAVCGRCVT
jgi:hypothetical protein